MRQSFSLVSVEDPGFGPGSHSYSGMHVLLSNGQTILAIGNGYRQSERGRNTGGNRYSYEVAEEQDHANALLTDCGTERYGFTKNGGAIRPGDC
jgi:hypothetical protein